MKKILLALAVLLVLAGCEKPQKTFRIATSPWIGYDLLHIAERKGYFKAFDLKIELIEFNSLTDSRRAYELGQVDAWCTTSAEYFSSMNMKKRPSKILIPLDYSNGADKIVARAPIDSIKALKGKRVSFEPGTLDAVLLALALQSEGMHMGDIKAVVLSQSDVFHAFKNSKIDAAVTFPPHSYKIDTLKNIRTVFDSSKIPGTIIDFIAVQPLCLEDDQAQIKKLIQVLAKVYDDIQKDPVATFKVLPSYQNIPDQSILESLAGIKLISNQEAKQMMTESGLLDNIYKIASVMKKLNMIQYIPESSDVLSKEAIKACY